ncbi:hypothetical protein ACPOL_4780 [Acidisarcina polymorpha]|uniref:Uncharacterized protein n=1 Tax=Acidisarcina polymorpha TaxID=2211140 RepID=A0A2Z5G665_9BACT|nr:hypothetical protein ACPOL_4780 [Acidisarcina polymorpha]
METAPAADATTIAQTTRGSTPEGTLQANQTWSTNPRNIGATTKAWISGCCAL